MSEYYAVQRSGDSLAHYGVKGMKWGVRKAIAKQSDRAMRRAYKKAQKHLKKLQTKADLKVQTAKAQVQGRKALRSGLVTAAVGGGGAASVVAGLKKGSIKPVYGDISREGKLISYGGRFAEGKKPVGISVDHPGQAYGMLGAAAVTAAGLGKTAYHAGKAIASKYRTTKRGHAKAVAKANAWKKEMNKAFAGTKYANGGSVKKSSGTSKKRRSSAQA